MRYQARDCDLSHAITVCSVNVYFSLHIEQEVHAVAVLHDVGFPFNP